MKHPGVMKHVCKTAQQVSSTVCGWPCIATSCMGPSARQVSCEFRRNGPQVGHHAPRGCRSLALPTKSSAAPGRSLTPPTPDGSPQAWRPSLARPPLPPMAARRPGARRSLAPTPPSGPTTAGRFRRNSELIILHPVFCVCGKSRNDAILLPKIFPALVCC